MSFFHILRRMPMNAPNTPIWPKGLPAEWRGAMQFGADFLPRPSNLRARGQLAKDPLRPRQSGIGSFGLFAMELGCGTVK
jgi:hypothetical protein